MSPSSSWSSPAAAPPSPMIPTSFPGRSGRARGRVSLGLVDRIGDLRAVLRERYGEDVVMRPIAAEKGFLRRRLGMTAGETTAASLVDGLIAAVEERLLWSRFGL